MNNVKSSSVKEVIGRVLRVARGLDSAYIADLSVWSYEALRALETKWSLAPHSAIVEVNSHQGCLPCGYFRLIAVEYCGKRLPYGGDVTHMVNPTHVFAKTEKKEVLPNEYSFYSDGDFDWSYVSNLNKTTTDYYTLQFDRINTSFPTGEVKIHYLTYLLDEEGYPLLPDSEEVKRAIYHYLLMMLCASGYRFVNNAFNDYNYMMQLYDEANRKAIEDMTSIPIDRMQSMKESMNRLLPKHSGWSEFNVNSERREQLDIHLDDLDYNGNR